jgi:hypothetical protein
LRLLEEIWERIEIIGGHVQWHNGRNGLIPRIIIDGLTGGEEEALHVWQIKDIGGVTCIYMPTNSFTVNGKDFTALQTGLTAIGVGSPDWYSVASFSTTGLNAYINFSNDVFTNMTGKPITLAFGTDATVSPTGKYVKIPILAYTATQGIYSLHHSAINYERTSFDGDLPSPKFRSIARPSDNGDWDSEDHTVGAYGFMTPLTPDEAPFAETPARTQHISLRETNSTGDGADVRWYNLRTLISDLKANLVADTSFLDDLGDAIGGYIPWNSDWDDKLTHTTLDFSGSTSAKGTGLSGGNTDHDDSYWHEAGLIASPFTDTKNYVTSGTVRAGEFALQGNTDANYWNDEYLAVSTDIVAIGSRGGTGVLLLGGQSSYDVGLFANIYFNDVAGVDISNWTTKGGLTGATIQEISIEDAQPSDKILVIRSA